LGRSARPLPGLTGQCSPPHVHPARAAGMAGLRPGHTRPAHLSQRLASSAPPRPLRARSSCGLAHARNCCCLAHARSASPTRLSLTHALLLRPLVRSAALLRIASSFRYLCFSLPVRFSADWADLVYRPSLRSTRK
jgi:hypothetical protein